MDELLQLSIEEKLERLMKLRGKEELTEKEQKQLDWLEDRIGSAFSPESRGSDEDANTTEEVASEVVRLLSEQGVISQGGDSDEDDEGSQRSINPDGGDDDRDPIFTEPRTAPWRRRAVQYFDGLATMKDDSVTGREKIANVKEEIAKMNKREHAAEEREAKEIIRDASELNRIQKQRVAFQTRLHTTSTSDTPKAGYLLPKPFLAEVFVILEQYGLARRLLRGIPMTSKNLDLKNVATKVVASWIAEGNRIVADDLVLAEGQLSVYKLAGLTSWTTEMTEDQAIALLPIVADQFAESMAEEEDKAAFLGDGSSTYGNNTGIVNLTNVQQHDQASTNTAASDLTESDLRTSKHQLSEARQMGAVWIMHRTIKDLIEQFENSAGYRIFQENISGTGPGTLLGSPVYTSEVMPASGSVGAGNPYIIYGNPTRMLMGMRRGLTADISREGVITDGSGNVTLSAFESDAALLRMSERVGFKVPSAYEDAFATVATASS